MSDDALRHGFPPIVDGSAQILILGSMPGQISLQHQHYYAHPRNLFWPIMAALFNIDDTLPYAQKTTRLLQNNIALWDVTESCQRPGSLDSAIIKSSVVSNDIGALLLRSPHIHTLFFNGKTAAALYRRHSQKAVAVHHPTIELHTLPSTSPAYAALSKKAKIAAWQAVKIALEIAPDKHPKNPEI